MNVCLLLYCGLCSIPNSFKHLVQIRCEKLWSSIGLPLGLGNTNDSAFLSLSSYRF